MPESEVGVNVAQELEKEVADLKEALRHYADSDNWHAGYDLVNYDSPHEYSNQHRYDIVWARNEPGWKIAAMALGEY